MSEFKRRFSLVEREEIVTKAHQCLWTKPGKPGLEYLIDRRKLSESVIREFQLGYIPIDVSHQLKGRIIFPLVDPSGNLITVGSRNVTGKSFLPVYWHESYEKPFYLYGIQQAKSSLRKHGFVLIVEGQFDVLQLYNHGIHNVVGLSGNKLSDVQISVMQRYCDELIILLDTDENKAGQLGASKIAQSGAYEYNTPLFPKPLFNEPQIMANRHFVSVSLPENSDPDEFVRNHGIDKLKKIVQEKRRDFHDIPKY